MKADLKNTYNIGPKSKAFREKYFACYSVLPLRYRIQIFQRWLGAPYLQVERFFPKKGKIFDLGCGLGNFSHVLALTSNQRKVMGIDFDRERIKLAKKTVAKDENLDFIWADIKKRQLEDCQGAVLFDVLHHIDFKFHQSLLTKIYDSLKPGGVLVMMESDDKPLWKYLVWRLWEVAAIGFSITRGESLSLRTKTELLAILKNIGFRVKIIPFDEKRLFSHLLYLCYKD